MKSFKIVVPQERASRTYRSTLLSMVAFLMFGVVVWAQTPYQVTASALNVRSGPSTGYGIIGSTYNGQVYVSIATSGSWHQIWYDDATGWVHGDYLTGSSLGTGSVTASNLNVRTGAGTGYSIVGTAPNGSVWAIASSSGAWDQIYYAGSARWVHGDYLDTSGSSGGGGLPTSSVGYVQLPASGPGYVRMSPASESWGLPALVYGLIDAGAQLNADHASWGDFPIRDLSLENGGPISGHASHQVGEDVDIRLLRTDGQPWGTTIYDSTYSYTRNRTALTNYLSTNINIELLFFNDSNVFSMIPSSSSNRYAECTQVTSGSNGLSYVMCWPNHHDHFHLRMNQ